MTQNGSGSPLRVLALVPDHSSHGRALLRRRGQTLRLGDGAGFRGEGILAVTKALLQSGVSYVGGYQGAPISHLMDVLADAEDILASSACISSERLRGDGRGHACRIDQLSAARRGHLEIARSAPTSPPMRSPTSPGRGRRRRAHGRRRGLRRGLVASCRSARHAFAMKSQIWLLDPGPTYPHRSSVEQGFELSEASHTPVMLMLRIRACHVHGRFRRRTTVVRLHGRRCARGAGSRHRRIVCRRPPTCRSAKKSSSASRRPSDSSASGAQRSSRRRATTSASSSRAVSTTASCARSSSMAVPMLSAASRCRCTFSTSPIRSCRRNGSASAPASAPCW